MLSYKSYILESILNWDENMGIVLDTLKNSHNVNISKIANQIINSKNKNFDSKLSKSDFNLKYLTNGMVKIDDRTEMRLGRFLRQLFPDITDDHIGLFLSEFESVLHNIEESKNFSIIDGKEIKEYYKASNSDMKSTLGNSCMVNCLNYLDIYCDNTDKVSLLIWKDSSKIKGRALLWKMDDGSTYMDRVYYSEEWVLASFINKAIREEWCWNDGKGNISLDHTKLASLSKFTVTLKSSQYDLYPYMDTFKYKSGNKFYARSIVGNYQLLGNTDGTLEYRYDYSEILKAYLLMDQTGEIKQQSTTDYIVRYNGEYSNYTIMKDDQLMYKCIYEVYGSIYNSDNIDLWIKDIKKYFLFDEYSLFIQNGGYKNINFINIVSTMYLDFGFNKSLIKVLVDKIDGLEKYNREGIGLYSIISIINTSGRRDEYHIILKQTMEDWKDKILDKIDNWKFIEDFITMNKGKESDFIRNYTNETAIAKYLTDTLYPSINDKMVFLLGGSTNTELFEFHGNNYIIKKT